MRQLQALQICNRSQDNNLQAQVYDCFEDSVNLSDNVEVSTTEKEKYDTNEELEILINNEIENNLSVLPEEVLGYILKFLS